MPKKNKDLKSGDFQLFRFSLYGFLKNQKYYEPFLILAFLEKGFSFTAIGALISFRSVSINLLEIPSGALADSWGRRRCMILSMLAYITSFVIFALAGDYWLFYPAMLAFSTGEAFRTGTHKAMIFTWLKKQGRENNRTEVYGFTRSWSNIGSAASVLLAAALVAVTDSYEWVFWVSTVPYVLNVVNFSFYPSWLDREGGKSRDIAEVFGTLRRGVSQCFVKRGLAKLIVENLSFEGYYSAAKDYLQPLLKAAAVSAPVLLSLSSDNRTRTAILVGITYAVLYLLSSFASRKSHGFAKLARSEFRLSTWILFLAFFMYGISLVGIISGLELLPIASFVVLATSLNIWKPVFTSRFYDYTDEGSGATTLSVANQSKTLSIAIIAPILGFLVDRASLFHSPLMRLWPVALLGIVFSVSGLAVHLLASMGKQEQGG